ncbi:hypothetical protein COCOR_04465 [Corallococcus coralloides DSM 2259]|uniref:Lipoprotein n=1 Tax=Corallococcus coralloides (strain ATCC 25202 / DSM 2259 / NBRC 100086 / M2) TaxID=1144275 RepID=H8MFE4_CORCM|nr:hypothetical protein [Corallococcus coralloides]AFE05851.1 hypothetical protein COCOR_04465 [Corallococcus coralloides DSM 2259]
MLNIKSVVSLCAIAGLTACGAGVDGEDGLATQESALVTGTSQGCTFTVSSAARAGTFPPIYDVTVTRAADATCAFGAGSLVVGSSTGTAPSLSLAANDLGVAVSYTYKTSVSGSSPQSLGLKHVAPDTLAIVRSTGLSIFLGSGSIYSGSLSIASNGTTLTVSGTKSGTISGQTGSGNNYVASYPDFFTSTTAPSIFTF